MSMPERVPLENERKAVYRWAKAKNVARWYREAVDPVQRSPDGLFRQLDSEFHFTVDAAASDANAKCERHFTVTDDSLGQDWGTETVWLNPPYGKGLREWMRKAWEASRSGATVVCLVPSSTDQGWWQDYACLADEIRFVRGRVAFHTESGKRLNNSFFPVSVIVFRPTSTGERVSLELSA